MRMEKMADIQDEYGNPIELTDEHGNPVVLTDEHGYPMRLTGVATRVGTTLGSLIHGGKLSDGGVEDGGHGFVSDPKADSGWHGESESDSEQDLQPHEQHEDGSSISSFEEDEQSERMKKSKKKKGFTKRIIEKLTGAKQKDQEQAHGSSPMTMGTKTASMTTMVRSIEHIDESTIDKISAKMSGNDLHAN